MNNQEQSRQSLLNLFSPPDLGDLKRKGIFGLLCGLSAEEQFMDCALEQFTGLSKNLRRERGYVSLSLFLDIHNEPIKGIPGLYNPWPNEQTAWAKIKLMHAKVALLGFGAAYNGKPDYYRLIVSTGNWTKEAVNDMINLVWYCDYDLKSKNDQKQNAKDIIEAVAFWQQLRVTSSGKRKYYQIADNVKNRIEKYLKDISDDIISPQRGYSAQFISNILNGRAKKVANYFEVDSMGAQVIKKFCVNTKRRNFIVCGSGFFEQLDSKKTKSKEPIPEPKVISTLVSHLKEKTLTRDPEKWLVINPPTAGVVGQWIRNTNPDDLMWVLCRPKHPGFNQAPYPFHAKYVFIANHNDSSESITSGLLYIGSGNLSWQGFASAPKAGGNIEAGVVFETVDFDNISNFCALLGIDPKEYLAIKDIPDQPKGEESEQEATEFQTPPPIASCDWNPQIGKLTFHWANFGWTNVTLSGQSIMSPNQMELLVENKNPDFSSGVKLGASHDGKCFEWSIPVFTANGNFWSPPPRPKSGRGIIEALYNFPATSYDDEDEDDDDGESNGIIRKSLPKQKDDFSEFRDELDRFPLHFATTLVEAMAIQNQQIVVSQQPDWIEHLRRTLIDEMKPEMKEQLRTLDINFLKPLIRTKGFSPEEPSKEYKKAILDIIGELGLK